MGILKFSLRSLVDDGPEQGQHPLIALDCEHDPYMSIAVAMPTPENPGIEKSQTLFYRLDEQRVGIFSYGMYRGWPRFEMTQVNDGEELADYLVHRGLAARFARDINQAHRNLGLPHMIMALPDGPGQSEMNAQMRGLFGRLTVPVGQAPPAQTDPARPALLQPTPRRADPASGPK